MATHRYAAVTEWEGSTALGYEAYGRAHDVTVDPAVAALALSSDPAFRGDASRLNPEQLLLAAATSCQLLAFLAVAARARIDVVGYRDEASAEMPDDDLPMRLTRIVLRPHITIRGAVATERIEHLVAVAHRECFIANSLRSEMVIEPTIEFED